MIKAGEPSNPALDALTIEMASPRIAASAQETMHPSHGPQRRLVLIHEEPFDCYACSWCGSRFPTADAPNGLTMLQILHLYRAQREKRFAEHVCSDRPHTHSCSERSVQN